MSDKFEELDAVLDEESWEWLDRSHPDIATIVQRSVARGLSPEEIAKRVIRRAGEHRGAFAKRCEMAARHLEGQQSK